MDIDNHRLRPRAKPFRHEDQRLQRQAVGAGPRNAADVGVIGITPRHGAVHVAKLGPAFGQGGFHENFLRLADGLAEGRDLAVA